VQSLDLVHPDSKSNDYVFKHALVRDSLYQSLLTEARKALHFKVAEEIERRSGNRLVEVAEVLAHHYDQTDNTEKTFTYVALSGKKSLGTNELLLAMAMGFRGQIAESVDRLWGVRDRCCKAGWTYITSATDIPLGFAHGVAG
jgi:hypothetical protein